MLMTNVPTNVIAACCTLHNMVMNLTMSGCKSVKVMPRMEPSQIQVMLRQQVAVQMVKKFVKFLLTTLNRTLCDIFVNNYYNVVDYT